MKKIAIALNQNNLLDHFGHCHHFAIYDISDNNQVMKETTIENPEHRPGFLPKFLYDQGVNVVVSENLGAKAKQIFDAFKIEVIFGLAGSKDSIIEQYLTSGLVSSQESCRKHEEHDHTGHEHDHDHGHHHH